MKISKLTSLVATGRKRLQWHMKHHPKDECARSALNRLDVSLRYCGGYADLLAVTQDDAVKEFDKREKQR